MPIATLFENLIGCPNCGRAEVTVKTESCISEAKTQSILVFTCIACKCVFGTAIPESLRKRLLLSMSKFE